MQESRVPFALALLGIRNGSSIIHSKSSIEPIEIDLIHNTGHICMLLRTDGIKAMSHGFLGGKQKKGGKICQFKKSQSKCCDGG